MSDEINMSTPSEFQQELEAFLRAQNMPPSTEVQEEEVEKPQSFWEALFKEMNFPGMDLMAVGNFDLSSDDLVEQRLFFRRSMRDFLKLLGYNYANDLRDAGVTEEGLFHIKKGNLPENFTVHLKYPLEYGGRIDFNNMVFMQMHPYHDLIHAYIDQQLVGVNGSVRPRQLFVPVPVGKVYVPTSNYTGSGGKNKQDRSTLAGFTQAALKDLMIKSMPGR